MTNPEQKFFCKDGYVINDEAKTLDFSESEMYWTQERIDASSQKQYQYYVYKLAAKIARQRKFSSGMDLGSGPGIKTKIFLSTVLKDIVLVDQPNTEKIAKEVLPSANFVGANLEDCNVDVGGKFDLIVCADVLEHLFNPIPCLKFALNHLAPSGVAIFSTPERDIFRGEDCMHSPHPSHVREWNSKEFNALLTFSGFEVLQQKCLPIEKLTRFEAWGWLFFHRIIRKSKWSLCQVAVCTKRSTLT